MNVAVVLSGGVGSRLPSEVPKQYIRIAGKLLITYCLETLCNHSGIDAVLVAAEPDWREIIIDDLFYNMKTDKQIEFAMPGHTRQFSILNALHEIKNHWNGQTGNVLIHDAARPNLTEKMIADCLAALNGRDGVMPVLPMKDTVYLSMDGISVSKLLDRKNVYAGQAPELFLFDKYYEANMRLMPDKLNQINGSTEPAILAGMDIAMIPGDENNYKITTIADLERFRSIVETDREGL